MDSPAEAIATQAINTTKDETGPAILYRRRAATLTMVIAQAPLPDGALNDAKYFRIRE